MIDKAIFKQYTKELDSYEFEKVDYDRLNEKVFDFNTGEPIQLFRLPKYNQFETEYEKLIDTLAKDAYEEICFWDIESKQNALKLLKEKKLRFKGYWEFEKKYDKLIRENSTDFDYIRFILSFFSLFDIRVKNEGFITNDGFLGNYGLVTLETIEDLHDALMNKEHSLDELIKGLESNLGLSKQPPATEQIDFEQQFKATDIPFKEIIATDTNFKKMLFDEFLVSDTYSLNIRFTKTVKILHNIQEHIYSLQDFFLNEANVNLSIDTYNEEAKVTFTNIVHQLEKFESTKLRVKIIESILENNISITALTDVYIKEKFGKEESKADAMFMSLKKRLNYFLLEYSKTIRNNEEKPAEQRGFYLGLTEPQLTVLHKELIDKEFLGKSTDVKYFINAFNGEVLKDFERLEWSKTIVVLTLFIGAIDSFKEQESKWQKTELIFKNCKAGNLRKTYSNQRELEKHKPNNLVFSEILDRLRTV